MQANRIAAILAVSTAAFSGAAFAESPNASVEQAFTSSTSRAAVQAELAQYKKDGVNVWSTSYNPLKSFKSESSRDQVRADYIASRDDVAAFTGEDSGAARLAQGNVPSNASTTLAGQAGQGNLR
jgi:hypothetical protein